MAEALTPSRYHLVERLAVGGMAEIFLATEHGAHGLQRLVVVKKMLPHLGDDPSFVEMFKREARVAARITHPNVVSVYDVGQLDGEPYMAMEYVHGSTVRDLLHVARAAGEHLPLAVTLDLVVQACAGAHAMHELTDPHGQPYELVHRDLTPHNLMVTDEGHLKVLDFGIVKIDERDARTKTGVLKGKVAYMSPEQCKQEPVDRRSDVFTLGIVAWELLAGERPFRANTEVGVMTALISGELPDLRTFRDVPEPIVAAVERALHQDPAARWPTADALRRGLLDAGRSAGVRVERDRTAAVVRRWLGERHDTRRRSIDGALDRVLLPLSPDPPTASVTRSMTDPMAPTRGLPAFGWMGFGIAGGIVTVAGVAGGAVLLFQLVTREPAYVPPSGEPVTVVLAPILDPTLLLTETEPLGRYLEGQLQRPVSLTVGSSYSDTSARLLDGRAAFAALPPYLYLKTHAEDPRVVPLATKVYDGSTGFDAILLVPQRSEVVRIDELVGSTICYTDPNSTTGYMLPRAWIREQGLDPDTDFVSHISGNHLQALRDLIDGTCGVAGTYSGNLTAADALDIPVAQTRVLAITGRTPHDVLCAGPGATPALADAMRAALLAFDPMDALHRDRLGDTEQITGFEPPDEAAFGKLAVALGVQ